MQPIIPTLKHYYQRNTTRARIWIAVIVFLLILVFARIALPYAIIYSTVSWLNGQGLNANIEDISIDIFNGSIILKNATGNDEDNHSFTIGDIELFWDWSPLSKKTVQVHHVKLSNIKLDIEKYSDTTIVSGLRFTPSTTSRDKQQNPDNDSTPWGTSLDTVELVDIAICYQQHSIEQANASDDSRDFDYCLHLDEMTWQGELSYKTDKQRKSALPDQLYYNSNGNFSLNSFVITDNLLQRHLLKINQLELNNVVINDLEDISLASVILHDVSSLQREDKKHIDAVRIKELLIENISFKDFEHLDISDITIKSPGLFLQKMKSGQWEYELWIPESGNTQENTVAEKNNPISGTTADKPVTAFTAQLGSVTIEDADFCYDDQTTAAYICFTEELFSWQGQSRYQTAENTLTASGNLLLQATKINNQSSNRHLLTLDSLLVDNVDIQSIDNIRIQTIKLDKLLALQRKEKPDNNILSINALLIKSTRFSSMNQLDIASITLDSPHAFIKKNKNGELELNTLLPAFSATTSDKSSDGGVTEEPVANHKPSITTSLGDIKIINPDLCYQDEKLALHYCLEQNMTQWQGSIALNPSTEKLVIRGKVLATSTLLNNKNLNRDLLKLQTLSINGIDIKSPDDIRLAEIKLDTLLALQRENANAYSVWFDDLTIEDISLAENTRLKVNTIVLKEPGLQLSKNEDGQWEHNKWLPADDGETADNKDKPGSDDDKKQNTSKKTTAEPAFELALNHFELNTKQKISFRDNSLTPVMHVGLKSINISINDIDSTRPKQKTEFSLQAQSDRHATIELAGDALPFAEKPSFDAKGKLLGFDLRAASPAAQKAIGHIIQSGQMDAELTLLAEEGVLDSNISLTLHQFNLKASSKEDAAELDETFGMPVNQSLTLLRDKDDSIHLDIPITGDINNPEFDPTHAIIKATTKATTVALITFYTPYGLVYAGGNLLFDLATAMDFEPVVFKPGSSVLEKPHTTQLDTLATMLTEKPQLHLTFCGTANIEDRLALFPVKPSAQKKDAEQKSDTKEETKKPVQLAKLSKQQRQALVALANERGEKTKQYLVDTGKIDHSRLILCTPAYSEEDDAISGVEINL